MLSKELERAGVCLHCTEERALSDCCEAAWKRVVAVLVHPTQLCDTVCCVCERGLRKCMEILRGFAGENDT